MKLPAVLALGLAFLSGSADPEVRALRAAYAGPPADWPAAMVDLTVDFVELGALEPTPSDPSQARLAALGAVLFDEPRLSGDGRTACRTCHDPALGWSNGRPALAGQRAVPALFVAARMSNHGWDGAHATLAAQVEAPLEGADEMGPGGATSAAIRLTADPAWPEPPDAETLVAALSAFLAGLDAPSRFDSFAQGESGALDDMELRGLDLFRGRAGCTNCHFGPLLSDNAFHNLGLGDYGEARADSGRAGVTGNPEDWGRFRTPSLRHIGQSAPYMHSGLFPTLEAVVAFYDRGGGSVWLRDAEEAEDPARRASARLSPHLRPLGLSPDDRAALVAFLRAL